MMDGLVAWIGRLVSYVCAIMLVIFTGFVLYSVMMRYVFSAPPLWGEDVPKLLFVWMTFLGGGACYLLNDNIRMTSVIENAPRGFRRTVEVLLHLGTLVLLAVILWKSGPILQLASRNTMLSTGWSTMWTYLALPCGAVLFALNSLVRIARILRGGVDTGPLEDIRDV